MDAAQQLRLKVSGAGHNIELTVDESETIGGIKTAVHGATGLHPSYQRLLIRGKAFDDDSVSLSTAGIGDRTKLMLMHSRVAQRGQSALALAAYAADTHRSRSPPVHAGRAAPGPERSALAGAYPKVAHSLSVSLQEYARDSVAAEAIATIAKELDGFEQGGAKGPLTPAALDEMATQLSCRLDAIDVGESATLRELRRTQLRRCEQLCSKL
tara:strand:+ start:2159 stop:2794 length:636 start_codon:yes stop_codon:yes gene_type:complete